MRLTRSHTNTTVRLESGQTFSCVVRTRLMAQSTGSHSCRKLLHSLCTYTPMQTQHNGDQMFNGPTPEVCGMSRDFFPATLVPRLQGLLSRSLVRSAGKFDGFLSICLVRSFWYQLLLYGWHQLLERKVLRQDQSRTQQTAPTSIRCTYAFKSVFCSSKDLFCLVC